MKKLRIAVIAANGRSGQAFVRAALKAGHEVTAGIRGEDTMAKHPRLSVMMCDAMNPSDIEQLLAGQDAVVSLIGHVKGSPADLQTTATIHAVNAMKKQGVKRIVSLTGTGARQPGDKVTLIDRLITLGVRMFDPQRLHDGATHIKVLEDSELDWTVIRVSKLSNAKAGAFRLTPHGPAKLQVSRDEVAKAILEVLKDKTFVQESPIVSSARD